MRLHWRFYLFIYTVGLFLVVFVYREGQSRNFSVLRRRKFSEMAAFTYNGEISRGNNGELIPIQLPAPEGWKKFYSPMGKVFRRSHIIFVSPSGEEVTNKRLLKQYLLEHPGSVAASEFDWGIGDFSRRSARLRKKTKEGSPEAETEPSERRPSNSDGEESE